MEKELLITALEKEYEELIKTELPKIYASISFDPKLFLFPVKNIPSILDE